MNKFARISAVCIIVFAVTGAAETRSDYKTSSSINTANDTILAHRFKETKTTNKPEPPTTETSKPVKVSKREPPASYSYKESSGSSSWRQPNSPFKWRKLASNRRTLANQHNPVHNVVAVASVSGIDSRNGRVSSINGFQVYPPVDSSMINTDNKGNLIFKSNDENMPITITKRGDGVSNTIRIQPGSVSVSSLASSSAKSGDSSAAASFSPWSNSYMMPPFNDVYFPPFRSFARPTIPDPVFDTQIPDDSFNTRIPDHISDIRIPMMSSRIYDPWFDRNVYKQSQERNDYITPKWYYPTFNPFMNFW